ncbi:VOC family protein [Marinobacter fonticola]|uniref:VOC family protein n=1 Tax=Marinobacter fonticola TaxID=2603215 RepID=UPI0011E6D0FB|nr:VOC family protein [Marinobacter fonticola]
MANRPAPFNGLRHLALAVPNLEECERFYTDIIGMDVLRRASDNLLYLTLGNDNLSLSRNRKGERTGVQYLDHFGFIVDTKEQLQEWYDYMKAEGVHLLDEPHDHGDGARSFHCTDPAGNVVQPIYHPAISGQRFSASG